MIDPSRGDRATSVDSTTGANLPLRGLRVLDLSRVLAGPYCSMQLGDLGADVIKIERPGAGDDTRAWGPPFVGKESAYFLCCNRNKRSLTVNLKHVEGRRLIERLAADSDVLLENFLPGTLDEWGLGYDRLSATNPRLVFCSITGFGQTGPRAHEPGYDIMIQAMAGVMSFTGEEAGSPMKVGVAISDITSGMFAVQAILAALFRRERTGVGDRIDIALFDSTLAWLANVGQNFLTDGKPPGRRGTAHPNIVPYQAFSAADGDLIVAVGTDAQFRKFAGILSVPELADDVRFATNAARVRHRDELLPTLRQLLMQQPTAHWLRELDLAGIPCGPIHPLDKTFAEPQVAARDLLRETVHPQRGSVPMVASPLRFQNVGPLPFGPAPQLGEHTDEVLRTVLRMSASEIETLRRDGVI